MGKTRLRGSRAYLPFKTTSSSVACQSQSLTSSPPSWARTGSSAKKLRSSSFGTGSSRRKMLNSSSASATLITSQSPHSIPPPSRRPTSAGPLPSSFLQTSDSSTPIWSSTTLSFSTLRSFLPTNTSRESSRTWQAGVSVKSQRIRVFSLSRKISQRRTSMRASTSIARSRRGGSIPPLLQPPSSRSPSTALTSSPSSALSSPLPSPTLGSTSPWVSAKCRKAARLR
mmetsp:Transcript_30048/g.67995  ORF Transcript_30048/g.67995 Transcript_30048/m.67995 type:complete len:227 (+) Transcript_30048:2307-2987(+)